MYFKFDSLRYSQNKVSQVEDFYSLSKKELCCLSDNEKHKQIQLIKDKNNKLGRIKIAKFRNISIVVILLLLYPIRFITYGIYWSLNELEEKNAP